MIPQRDVPVIINSFNRLASLTHLVEWLRAAGHRNLIVIDNASCYPPLLRYLDRIERDAAVRVVRLGGNVGHLALWQCNLLADLRIDSEFVYTDPDVVPDAACPHDLVGRLQRVLRDEPGLCKAGPALRLDDIPASFMHRAQARDWETKFWMRPAAPGLFIAQIDTTFALYRPGAGHGRDNDSARLGWPYVASHRGWFVDSGAPSEEDVHYARVARRDITNWSLPDLDPELVRGLGRTGGCFLRLGSAGDSPAFRWPGFINRRPGRLDLPDGSMDGIHADRAFGNLCDDPVAWSELRRVVRPGAMLVLRGPASRIPACFSRDKPPVVLGARAAPFVARMEGRAAGRVYGGGGGYPAPAGGAG